MATEALIAWEAPTHLYTEKRPDWYWAVGIITLAIATVLFMFGEIITGIFVVVAALALALHASQPPRTVRYEINDRGIMSGKTLYPFLTLDSFCIPHDEVPPRLLVKSRKLFMPLIVMYIDSIDPEEVREVLLKYIAEAEHSEPFLKKLLEAAGF
ncbi:MAG: hypothetical protein KGI69_04025 [Patescibacteria group bacterium]|nr:hypothetical protein [Patescibacteria group bacterium]